MFEKEIANGIELLNEKYPGWVDKINLNTFRIDNCYKCIIGQLYGTYYDYTIHFPNINPHDYCFIVKADYSIIATDEWKERIKNLKMASSGKLKLNTSNILDSNKEIKMKKEEQYIEFLKAYLEGKTIEYREKGTKTWYFKPIYLWNFSKYEYRIKPEPKEIWMIKGGQHIFNSEKDIIDHCCFSNTSITQIIHFKEVV